MDSTITHNKHECQENENENENTKITNVTRYENTSTVINERMYVDEDEDEDENDDIENFDERFDENDIKGDELTTNEIAKHIIQALSNEGPIVKSVVLRVDGTIEEIDYDTTPRKNEASIILKGPPTIIGEWSNLQVILIRGRFTTKDIPFNKHKLRFPFQNAKIRGDILLYRVGDDGIAINFTMNEYKEFVDKSYEDDGESWEHEFANFNDDDNVDNNNNNNNNHDNHDNDTLDSNILNTEQDETKSSMLVSVDELRMKIQDKVLSEFEQTYDRKPTDEELKMLTDSLYNNVIQQYSIGVNNDDDEDVEYVPEDGDEDEDENYDDDDDNGDDDDDNVDEDEDLENENDE